MAISTTLPPLLPKVDAILVLDGEGNRLAGKYYGDFLTNTTSSSSRAAMAVPHPSDASTKKKPTSVAATVEDLRSTFERQLQSKIQGIAARADAAEVVTVMGKTAVFCGGTSGAGATGGGGGDVRVVHVGPTTESELVLAHLCEGMYDALSNLMGGHTDRNIVLDNLELVFLLIDEHCDGGLILETDGGKLAGSVLLRDEEKDGPLSQGQGSGPKGAGGPKSVVSMVSMGGDMTIGQAFRQAREQLISNLAQRDSGM